MNLEPKQPRIVGISYCFSIFQFRLFRFFFSFFLLNKKSESWLLFFLLSMQNFLYIKIEVTTLIHV